MNDVRIVMENHEYQPNIRTVMLHRSAPDRMSDIDQLSEPVVALNTNDKLLLSFDDLQGGAREYYYTFLLCTANWEESNDLVMFDYIKGYTEDRITDYKYSFNTIQPFTHYKIIFPNDNIRPIKSGNYVVLVYADSDKEKPVLTRRFMIVDQKVTVTGRVHQATIPSDRDAKQEVDFSILHPDIQIPNPFADLKVVVRQNSRWDNACTNLQPLFIRENELVYDYEKENVFNGGNEFRFVDLRSLKIVNDRVRFYTNDSLHYVHSWLNDEVNRSRRHYFTETDINGRFFCKTVEGWDYETQADYTWTHFNLPYTSPQTNGTFYLFGELSDWAIRPEFKLHYNSATQSYQDSVLLKQGYYNYDIVFLEDGKKGYDETFLEGNHYETENEYVILVYFRSPAGRYDQLIGFQKFNSVKLY